VNFSLQIKGIGKRAKKETPSFILLKYLKEFKKI